MNRPANSSIHHPGNELYDMGLDEIVNEPAVPEPELVGPKPGLLKRLHRRFSVLGLIGLVLVAFWMVIAVIGPWIAPYKSGALSSVDVFAGSSHAFLLGTDYLGRDMPLVQGCVMVFCAAYLALVLIADLCQIVSNPRLRQR